MSALELEVEAPLTFVVLGHAQQKGSKIPTRTSAGAMYVRDENPEAAPWEARIASAARYAFGERPLIRRQVELELAFYFARPKSHYGTGRNAELVKTSAPRAPITRPDLDKLARCAIDALTGVVLADDSLVTDLYASKRFGEPERLEARIR
jgi:crossover junction endodeoxyribonuclease RusA